MWILIFLQKDEVYLNLVLEYVPETVYRVARHYSRNKQTIPMIYIKVSFAKCNVCCSLLSKLLFGVNLLTE